MKIQGLFSRANTVLTPSWEHLKSFFMTKTLFYLEPPFGTFHVFTVKLQPVLYCPADSRVCVVHKLEACHIGTSLPEFCEIKIQKSLKANKISIYWYIFQSCIDTQTNT